MTKKTPEEIIEARQKILKNFQEQKIKFDQEKLSSNPSLHNNDDNWEIAQNRSISNSKEQEHQQELSGAMEEESNSGQ